LFAVSFVFFWKEIVLGLFGLFLWTFAAMGELIERAVDFIGNPIKEHICKPFDAKYVEPKIAALTPDDIATLFNSRFSKDAKLYRRWADSINDQQKAWELSIKYREDLMIRQEALKKEKNLEDARRLKAEYLAAQETKRLRELRRQRLMRLAAATQKFAPVLLALVAAPVLGAAIWGFYWIGVGLIRVPWFSVGHELAIVLGCFIAFAAGATLVFVAGVFIVKLIKKVFSKCWALLPIRDRKEKPKRTWPRTIRIFRMVGNIFVTIGTGVADAFALLKEYVKATKDGYCPKIEWKE
jgi:hypothetical protein